MSVMVTIVLLKDAWTWATPLCTIRRSFFFPFLMLIQTPYPRDTQALRRTHRRFWFASHTGATAFSRPRIRLGSLAADGQPFPVAQTTVCAAIDQSLDVHREGLSQIAFDLITLLNNFSNLDDMLFTQVFDANRSVNPSLVQDRECGRPPNPIDIGEANVRPFFPRQIHSRNTSHSSSPYFTSHFSLRMTSSDSHARVQRGPSEAARCASRSLMRSSSGSPTLGAVCGADSRREFAPRPCAGLPYILHKSA